MIKRLQKYLLAILIGNVIYFALSPHLPAALQGAAAEIGWGTLLDFAICVAVYWLFEFAILAARRIWR